ncbi:MAG: hypothetical protein JWQ74_2320 [Marmoricola sp.]|nr:hypothetical protein [Marmoricola sp.]
MTDPAAEHRQVAGRFTDLVGGASPEAWDSPAPVEGWTARDVVGHLVTWLPGLLESGAGVVLPAGPPATEDPVGAWTVHVDAVQALLDDPGTAAKVLSNPHLGEIPLDQAIARFYTADVFMHTWDLARATGQDDTLDAARCAEMLAGMEPMDEMLRSSGQYGAQVPVAGDAPAQDRLMGFIGRDPAWSPAGR